MTNKYRFIKDYTCQFGQIKTNTEIQFMGNAVYVNGGMMSPDWAKVIIKIIEDDVNGEYVRPETPVVGEF